MSVESSSKDNSVSEGKRVYECGGLGASLRAANIPLSAAVSGAGLVFVSGLPAFDWDTGELKVCDVPSQTRHALDNVRRALEEADSSLDLVLKTTIYCSNVAYFQVVNDIYAEYFPSAPPARTFVTVGSWPMKFDVEVEAIALQRKA
jgi:2-iminobutanoate/2-iminopropanoate deaminase